MASQSNESKAARATRFAEIYLFEHPGNITRSYEQLVEEYKDAEKDTYTVWRSAASKYFKKKDVQKAISDLREQSQAVFDIRKEEIVANLKELAFDDATDSRTRLASLRQLTDIAGLATQNINLNAKADIEVVIE